jgi:DNA polymerase-1
MERDPSCKRCPLHKTARTVCIGGDGPTGSDVVFVGEAPGPEEDRAGRPFIGRAGKLLDQRLKNIGMERSSIFITNAVKCFPGRIRRPTLDERKACSKAFLHDEIKAINPKVVVAVGKTAYDALKGGVVASFGFLGKSGIGEIVDLEFWEGWLVPVVHPAAVLRDRSRLSLLDRSLASVKSLLRRLDDGTMTKVETVEPNGFGPSKYAKARSVVLDLETTGLDPWEEGAKIRCCVMSPLESDERPDLGVGAEVSKSWYIASEDERRTIIPDEYAKHGTKPVVGHNIGFDLRWLFMEFGTRLGYEALRNAGPFDDTMIAHFLLDETAPSHSLKSLAWKFTELGGYEPKGNPATWPDEVLFPYAIKDVEATRALARRFLPRIEEKGFSPVYRLLMDALPKLAFMESRGVHFDLKRATETSVMFHEKTEGKKAEIREWLSGRFPSKEGGVPNWVKGFNPASPKQVGDVLYTRLSAPLVKEHQNDKELPTSKDALEELKSRGFPLAGMVLEFRKLDRATSTMKGMIERYGVDLDGNIVNRTQYLLHGAKSGRISSRNPNLQNIPKEEAVHSLIIPRPGFLLAELDFSQIELRVAAWLADDKLMIELFQDRKTDFHQATADAIGLKRSIAKNLNFAVLYGGGPPKIASMAEVSIDEAQDFQRRYFERFAGLRKWIVNTQRNAERDRFVRSPFGRKRRLPNIRDRRRSNKRDLNISVNSPIQATASDINLLALIETSNLVPEAKPVLIIHDSIVFEVPSESAESFVRKLQDIMESLPIKERFGVEPTVPFFVDAAIGERWGESMKDLTKP